jgi:putative DNA primase/helicase
MNTPFPLFKNSYQPASSILTNLFDIVNQFINDAASKRGLMIINPVADGCLHRCAIADKPKGNKDGAYLLHADGFPRSGFQNHTDGLGWQDWRADIGKKPTQQEIIAQQAKIDEARRQREIERHQRHGNAAAKAAHLWKCARPAINHPYLVKKKIKAYDVRQLKNGLLIPVYDESNRLVNAQFISPIGEKRFLSGGRKRGCFFVIGDLSERILICEGYATGSSLFEHSGQRVIVAFDANNLLPVAKNIREVAPDSEIIICGDNDLSGVGQKAASEAALAVSGKVLIPPIDGMDWNDYLNAGGEHA